MRGQGDYDSHLYIIWRITPADAGTSWVLPFTRQPSQDHPRGCGDKSVKPNISAYPQGSPPRMRGQELFVSELINRRGITPADAGTSCNSRPSKRSGKDHPRGCGDKLPETIGDAIATRSPPRMRGQVGNAVQRIDHDRITPADAGTRSQCPPEWPDRWDHPRGCGDKGPVLCINGGGSGSPPRMRGQASASLFSLLTFRITPADAGTRNLK